MWGKKVDIIHEPMCSVMPDELKVAIPVCRDELRKKYEEIEQWRKEGYKFEKLTTSGCKRCNK